MRKYIALLGLRVCFLCPMPPGGSAPDPHRQAHVPSAGSDIDDIHRALSPGKIPASSWCNYISTGQGLTALGTKLLTEDMAAVLPGIIRTTSWPRMQRRTCPLGDPKKTVPLESARMEPNEATDPTVSNRSTGAGLSESQTHPGTSALATINLRGQRSVDLQGDFDRKGNLPAARLPCAR